MKLFLLSLLLLAAPPWVSQALAAACDCRDAKDCVKVVVKDGKTATGCCEGRVTAPEQMGKAFAMVGTACTDPGDGRSEPKVIWIGDKEKGQERAWLGVSIDKVPGPLASQLDIEGRGVMVVNVVGGSPADRAGFQPHDVILKIDGKVVEGEVGPAIDLIKSRKPGEEVGLVVLRDGKEKSISVKLGSRDEVKNLGFEWKFEDENEPDVDVEESVRTRGKILMRGPGDEWIIEDLGDLEQLKELPKHIRKFIPESGRRSIQINVDGDQKKLKVKVEREGGIIVITQEGDGPIIVKRTDKDGRETTATYDSGDELRTADEEAYDLWEKAADSAVIHLDLDGVEVPDIDLPEFKFDFDIDSDELMEHAQDWRANLEKSLSEAQEAYERAMKQFREAMEQWKSGKGSPEDFQKMPFLPFMFRDKEGHPELPWSGFGLHGMGKPRHTFEVRADGKIEVRIRKGDSELVRVYDNEDDLKRRDPDLFKKYEKLMSADKE
jgi:hypothetical protein